VTPPDFGFRRLLDVDPATSTITVAASPDPTQQHVFRLPLDPAAGKAVQLTSGRGLHVGTFSADHVSWVHEARLLDAWPSFEVLGAAGKPAVALESRAEVPALVPDIELIELPGNRHLRAAVVRPHGFDGSTSYPVIVNMYGGPHHQMVTASRNAYLMSQWMADQGFVVVSIDGRGTPNRGREWERAIHGDLGNLALEDQVEGVQELSKRFGFLDRARVGTVGWSFGGYLSAMCTIRRPDIFAAGVAGAPVTDWADYDTHYTERYLGVASDGEAYTKSSVLTYAPKLKQPLLIVHGTSDDNVLFSHSLKLADALLRAGRPFELLPLSGFTHMVPDPAVAARLQERVVSFLAAHLGKPGDGGAADGGDEGYDDSDDYRD
jgi:dipeptidyl-peptidase-4